MATLTLDVPPSVANHWNTLSAEERLRRAAAFVETIEEEVEHADIRTAIAEGIADADAGRTIPFEQLWAERRAYWKEKGYSLK